MQHAPGSEVLITVEPVLICVVKIVFSRTS